MGSNLEETMGWKNNPELQESDLPSEVEQKQNKVFNDSHINENIKSKNKINEGNKSTVVHNIKTNLVKEHSKKEDRKKERYPESIRDQSQHGELLTGSTRYLKEAQLKEETKDV